MRRLRPWQDQRVKRENSSGESGQHSAQQGVPSSAAPEGANDTSVLPGVQHPAQAVSQNGDRGSQKWRIALYSYDTMGFGHRRRSLLIAQMLAYSPLQPVTLIITGVGEANTFVK